MEPKLPPNQQLAAPGKWPVVGEKAPLQAPEPWSVTIWGWVERPHAWSLAALQAMPQVERVVDIHCVTRWSKLGARFSGVALRALLEICSPLLAARFLSFVARSERRHSTSLSLDDALRLDVLVALAFDGQPLPSEHGGPVRIVTPGRYFYKSVKWLESIEVRRHDRLGYWEAEAGYHNGADPWLEQRYMAPDLDRGLVRALLESRNFAGRELRSLSAAGRDLRGLDARRALLRDADFRGADLRDACFDAANLSNGHLEGADLRGATFRDADLEGADFRMADLRGADLAGASLLGATFCAEDGTDGAIVDADTLIDGRSVAALAPGQQAYLARAPGA